MSDVPLDRLLNGYRRFLQTGWLVRRETYQRLAERGQQPAAMVVACVDSRVDPAMIFDCGPGELLIVRNVANLVPPYAPDSAYHGTSAALEFGVRVLQVPNLIVLGHGSCGGVRTLLDGAPPEAHDFVVPWMSMAAPALRRALACDDGTDPQLRCEQEVVKLSLDNLLTFPWIAERVADQRLALHGMWFAIHSGQLTRLGADGEFVAMS